MIVDTFSIYNWNIKILYDCTCEDTDYIVESLLSINCPTRYIKKAILNIDSCNLNIGLTYSNLQKKESVIVISKTSTKGQFINTISHEYFHLLKHLSKYLEIDDEEELATLNGELNMKSFNFIENINQKVGLE